MRGAATRRRGNDSYAQPPPQPTPVNRRDSDASFCSSRPSSVGISGRSSAADFINDKSYQKSAIHAINSFLSSHSSKTSLKSTLPSAKDITDALKFILLHLNYPCGPKLEDDLPFILKFLSCPIKVSKSVFRAPGTPHSWPSLCGVMHWLVQLAMYNEHITSMVTGPSILRDNSQFVYEISSYMHFLKGDDDAMEAVDREVMEKLEAQMGLLAEKVEALKMEEVELEAKLEELKTGPSEKEKKENERSMLENDVVKFDKVIVEFQARIQSTEKSLEEKEKALAAKVEENRKICEENEELKTKIESQTFNFRDVDRMKRELQAVERNIGEAEVARNAWEEKSWDLDSGIGRKFKEIESLSIECNQAMKRLKLGNAFEYVLNAKGTTPAEVMGIDYKSTLKPTLDSFADDIKKGSMEKLEESISLQQQSVEIAATIEGKRKQIAALQSRIDEVEPHLNLVKKEMHDYISRCAMEAKRVVQDVETEAHNLDNLERDAADMVKVAQFNLQEAINQSEDAIQLSAHELFALVDSVSKYKEYMSAKISEMRATISETVSFVADAYKSLPPT